MNTEKAHNMPTEEKKSVSKYSWEQWKSFKLTNNPARQKSSRYATFSFIYAAETSIHISTHAIKFLSGFTDDGVGSQQDRALLSLATPAEMIIAATLIS